jgi:hypothetical protein
MNKEINDTIKEIIFSVIQFNTDIEKNNATCLNKFINNFIPLLKRFKSLTIRHEADYIDFIAEFSNLYDYLFTQSKIFEIGKGLITVDNNNGIEGTIIAIKHNGNPLPHSLKRVMGRNLFNDFVSKYEGLYIKESIPDAIDLKPIIERERLALIFRKYKDFFNEPEDTWIKRFVYRNEAPVNPLTLDPKAIEGSNKLVMLAILALIQDKRKDSFDYNDFVFDRFGIKNFDKARHDHKGKRGFKETFEECNAILIE